MSQQRWLLVVLPTYSPVSFSAGLYDPLTVPVLVKAHQSLDRAIEQCQ